MRVSLERDLELHADEEILAPKVEEPQIDVKQPHTKDPGVETSTHAESSRKGRKCTREANRLLDDARENVGEPTSQHKQRRSPERCTGCMDLMGKCVVTEPSSFKEAVQQPVWVDVMVEEYDFIFEIPTVDQQIMQQTKEKYKIYFYNKLCGSLIEYQQDQENIYN